MTVAHLKQGHSHYTSYSISPRIFYLSFCYVHIYNTRPQFTPVSGGTALNDTGIAVDRVIHVCVLIYQELLTFEGLWRLR